MASIISLRGVSKVYQRGSERLAVLDHFDLDIEEGDFVAIMGPSGSGKTTLLNLIAGIDSPSSGTVTVAGEHIEKLGGKALARCRQSDPDITTRQQYVGIRASMRHGDLHLVDASIHGDVHRPIRRLGQLGGARFKGGGRNDQCITMRVVDFVFAEIRRNHLLAGQGQFQPCRRRPDRRRRAHAGDGARPRAGPSFRRPGSAGLEPPGPRGRLGGGATKNREGGLNPLGPGRPGGRRVPGTTAPARDSSLSSELRSPGFDAFDASRSKTRRRVR